MQDEGIGVEYKDHTATALTVLKLAESTIGKNVHIANAIGFQSQNQPRHDPKSVLNSLRMVDGRALMPLGFKAKISQDMIHIPTRIIRGGETIQTSNGESHNKPNHKEALGNNPRASTTNHTHPLKSNQNLPQIIQVMLWIMIHLLSY
ncbi:hypothetical protein ACFXTH_033909 [Malus domestica]